MIGSKRERWMEWAAQAAEEQDPEKLMALAQEINSILEANKTVGQRQTTAKQ